VTLAERTIDPGLAEDWIRETLELHPEGARLTVSGTCMEPFLAAGTKVTLIPAIRPARVGEVVLLRTDAGLRLHRVVLASAGRIRTKGDRGIYLDPPAPRSAVIAVCATGENRFAMRARAIRSLVRLCSRPWRRGLHSADGGDPAHATLLA
jgi:hypothetical protein